MKAEADAITGERGRRFGRGSRILGISLEHRVQTEAQRREMLQNWFEIAANQFVDEGRVKTHFPHFFSLLE
jgi:hypothetical protein